MTRILVLEHEADAPAALFGTWLVQAGAEVVICRPAAGDPVPDLTGTDGARYDGWLVLGGEMGAEEDEVAPWLPTVRSRIAEAAQATEGGVAVLGICLGHQLAAVATGGRVILNPAGQRVGLHDIGWFSAAAEDPLFAAVATPRRAVQWNRDVVLEVANGGEVLARSADAEIQAARFAPSVWGVQWHPEVDRAVVADWAEGERENHRDHDPDGRDIDAVLASIEDAAAELAAAWRPLAERFAEICAARGAAR